MPPSLSLILPAFHVTPSLRRDVVRLLETLSDLTPRFELLIVDPGSADHAVEIARELSQVYPQVQFVQETLQPEGEAVLVLDGPLTPQELLRQWRMLTEMEETTGWQVPVNTPNSLNHRLLERLARWGEHLKQRPVKKDLLPQIVPPANFREHLQRLVDA